MSMGQGEEAAPSASGGMVNVKFGIWGGPGPYAGITVKQLKSELAESTDWGVDSTTKVFRGKTELSDDAILNEGDSVELVKKMGEKGMGE